MKGMNLYEIKEQIKELEELNVEINRFEHVLNQGIYQVVVKENYYLRENVFQSEQFKLDVTASLQRELEDLKTRRSVIHEKLNIGGMTDEN